MIVFASDFDNTLHFVNENRQGYFRKEDLEAIRQFRKEGNVFGLCTGRPLYGLQEDFEGGLEMDFIISSTGALLSSIDKEEYRTIFEETISVDDVQHVYEDTYGRGVIFVHADGQMYTIKERSDIGYPRQIVIQDVQQLAGKHITGISVWTPSNEQAHGIVEEINYRYSSTIAAYQNGNWIDVVNKVVSKGNMAVQAKNFYKADCVVGIGDNYNDIPLLEKVDIGFTFHSSPEEVKKAATHVVDSIAEAMAILKQNQ